MRKGVVVWVAMAVILAAGAAWGADTTSLQVSASVVGTCKFTGTSYTLDFGSLDPAANVNVTAPTPAVVGFWCTKGVTETILAGNGLNWNGSHRQLQLVGGGEMIPYDLTLTTGGGTNLGPGSPRTVSISGIIQAGDYTGKSAGSYADTVVVQINP